MSTICDDLRAAILQAAMQGKLTKREPSDDNTDELRKTVIKEHAVFKPNKFIKKDSGETVIPDEWSSLKSGEVFELVTGKRISNGNSLPLLDAKYFRGKRFSRANRGNLANKGDVLILVDGENSGEAFLCTESGYMGSTFRGLFVPSCINKDYALYFLDMNRKILHSHKRGAAIPHLDKKLFLNFIFPIPSLAEQKRIVEKVDELMARVDDLEKSADALASMKKVFPDDIKASLLQAAMQGKLTEQLPEDGNAEDLLEEIKTEREKLITEDKIKKQKPLAPIADDEIPFGIPENWKWVRFGGVNELISGTDLTSDKYASEPSGVAYITGASNIQNGTIIKNRWTKHASRIAKKGDLLLTCKGTIGNTAILDVDEAHIARQIMAIRPVRLNVCYVKYFIEYMAPSLKSVAKSMIPGIERGDVLNMAFPLPPFAEQKRIVKRLDTLMQSINAVGDLIVSE